MEEEKLEYRMYSLVLRQLSAINKGVQTAHVCLEYANKYKDEPDYIQYVNVDKTLIMLDGGTYPDLRCIIDELEANNIKYASFKEPDLGDIITAITFIADSRIWESGYAKSFEEYCDFMPPIYENWISHIGGYQNLTLLNIIKGKRLSL